MRRAAALLLLIVAFGVLATANSAGYRYGIADQALYIPAFDLARAPQLFPRDRQLIVRQADLMLVDEVMAAASRATGLGLQELALAGYAVTVTLFVMGVALIGRRLYRSPWTVAALALALTLRHRISHTGVNTFEGYFHPRVLAFSIGLVAVGLFWRGRRFPSFALALAAVFIHPTLGGWFVLWIGTAWVVAAAPSRRALAMGVGIAGLGGAALVAGGAFAHRLVVMDATWRSAFSDRDYLFPLDDWTAGHWVLNLLGPALIAAGVAWRGRLGLVTRAEAGLAAGALALLGAFLASLPFITLHVALAVQLQTSRVLWLLECLGTAYLVWGLAEAPWASAGSRRRQVALVAVLAVASGARGYYVLRVEHSHPLVSVRPPASDWMRMGVWIAARTPVDAHLLADPRHVWPYGTSLRIAARRDVLTEDVKDAAVAIYGRDVALRVLDRRQAVGDFYALTEADFLALDRKYDLDYLIAERPLQLPVVHREGALTLYALGQGADTSNP